MEGDDPRPVVPMLLAFAVVFVLVLSAELPSIGAVLPSPVLARALPFVVIGIVD